MGDSSCLIQHQHQQQPFSYTSGFSHESMEGNHPNHVLGQSVSFGRFMPESLDWEKWSTFSHNRYVEEAEKYSKPGSVAQKKAFFEAHYKKLAAQKAAAAAAAALLEQENFSSSNSNSHVSETQSKEQADYVHTISQATISTSDDAAHEQKVVRVSSAEEAFVRDETETETENVCDFEEEKFHGCDLTKNETPKRVELKIQLSGFDLNNGLMENEFNMTPQMEKSTPKTPSRNREQPPSTMCKKKAASSSKLPLFSRASKVPSSPSKPNVTPAKIGINIIKHAVESADKRKSTPKSLRMAINFTPIREFNKLTSTVMRKIERSRVGPSSSKVAKDCSTPLRTPNMALKSESQKLPSGTPWSEKKRNKLYSPFSFTPFSLRTEERAARRKEKLEEKFNKNEPQKVQLQTKLKEKAETEIRKLGQSFCFKARPLPEFYKERKSEKKKEVLPMSHHHHHHPQSPKLGSKTRSNQRLEAAMSQCGHRPPMNSKNVKGKTHSVSLRTVMCLHENKSPNIQH